MTHLAKALGLWSNDGHTQQEFSELTGIDHATTSRIFQGKRGLTRDQRQRIWNAFADRDPVQALRLFIADIRDNVPGEALDMLELSIKDTSIVKEAAGRGRSLTDEAVDEMIRNLQQREPEWVKVALHLKTWRGK